MSELETILALLIAMTVLVALARRLNLPYPILLVLGGLAIGFIPGLPTVELDPEIVFLIFLPPLLQSAAFFTSIRDFRANVRPIALLAIGLVLFTTCIVAVVAHATVQGLSWPVAFVLGAIVSPPDAVAATSIAQRLNLPRRIVTLLEGESLLNDATALVAYRVAVAAVVSGVFSWTDAAIEFLQSALGGVAVGFVIGWLTILLLRRVSDTAIAVTISLLVAFMTYLVAERLHVSGVLGVVTTGLLLGRQSHTTMSPRTRLQGEAVWTMVVFMLNGLVFILIGLQLQHILDELGEFSLATLVWYGTVISVAAVLARIAWVFPVTYIPRWLNHRLRKRDPYPGWRNVSVVAWTGMRGVVSLAAALSLPEVTRAGAPFPQRDLVIFLTFSVIFATLVVQGLSVPLLIRLLGIADDGGAEREEAKARFMAARAGLDRLEQLAEEDWVAQEMIEDLSQHYELRARRFGDRYHGEGDGRYDGHALSYQRLQAELIGAEQEAIVRLRNEGVINDEVMRRVQRDLDLEKLRLEH